MPGEIHPFVFLLFVLAIAFAIRRTAGRVASRRRRSDPLVEAQRTLESRRTSPQAQLDEHQLQLMEISREAEATLKTKITVLDKMIVEADLETARLEQLLAEIRDVPSPRLPTDTPDAKTIEFERSAPAGESAQYIRLLGQTGFRAEEIARVMNLSVEVVQDILAEFDGDAANAA